MGSTQQLDLVVHGTEAGGWQVLGQPRQLTEALSQKKTTQRAGLGEGYTLCLIYGRPWTPFPAPKTIITEKKTKVLGRLHWLRTL